MLWNARAGSANSVIYLFLYRAVRLARFVTNFLNYVGRLHRRIIDVGCYAFTTLRLTLKGFRRAMERIRRPFAPFRTRFIRRSKRCLRVMVLFITCRVGRLISKVVYGTRFNDACVLHRMSKYAIHARR